MTDEKLPNLAGLIRPNPSPNPSPEPSPAAPRSEPSPSPVPPRPDAGAPPEFSASYRTTIENGETQRIAAGLDALDDGGEAGAPAAQDSRYLSPETFFSVFAMPFSVTRMAIAQRTGVALDALNVTAKTEGAREAAASCFELCKSIPWLEPLTRKDGAIAVHGVVLAGFAVSTYQAAALEFRAKTATVTAAAA